MSTKINQADYERPSARSNHYDQHFQKIQAYFIIFMKTVIEDCRKSKTTNYMV